MDRQVRGRKGLSMRLITVALGSVLVAAPAFATGHGHVAAKPGQTGSSKTSDADKSFKIKKSDYEKKLQATERESDQAKVRKMKGLTHPPVEASDLADSGKGERAADNREAPPPKINGNASAGVAAPSLRGGSQGGGGGSSGGGH